ncbi:hypothetical protein MNBD_ALPHA05-973 [hydrothermal vent metagenome]|uniref:Uncharacterized protein n=1 Tax=hydrothermal vent metagenome TaxID=652676 RepID=A0A3B0SL27_9ZZZZ
MKVGELLFALGAAVTVSLGGVVAEDEENKAPSEEAEDAAAPSRLGPKVERICFGRSINGWKTVDGQGDAVLLRKSVNDWYLVEVSGNCRARDFKFVQAIGLESHPAGGCIRRGDYILVESGGGFTNRCFIQGLYEWNDDAPEEEAGDGSDDS